jgi:hypothetical protein
VLSVGDPQQQELAVAECMQLLGTTGLGRLGFTQAAMPAVQPVTYRVAEGAVLIPAVPGSRAANAIRDGIVVLAVDSFRAELDDGWAVTVVGPVRLVDGSLLLEPVVVSGWRRTTTRSGRPA